MKTQLFQKTAIFLLIVFLIYHFANGTPPPIAILANDETNHFNFSGYTFSALPDTTIQHQEGDTIDTYTSGGDSVFVLYEDTIPDTAIAMGWYIPTPTEHMIIEFTEHHLPIEQGLLGVNVTDMFEPGHANADELAAKYGAEPDPWDYLSDMQPKVLRFPSGAGGKFYQPLGSIRTNPDDPDVGMLNGGYGINIDEVIRFYDVSDPGAIFNAPPLYGPTGIPGLLSIEEDMADNDQCNQCGTWMATGQISTFEDNYLKWASQPVIDPALLPEDMGNDLYINQFIDLVHQIESENGYTVDVLVCINILNQTATEAVRVIEYLQDNGIHIAGVEIGNEVYFEWAELMLGFKDTDPPTVSPFIRYWDYINGYEYVAGTSGEDPGDGTYLAGDFDLASVLPADVLADHDYLGALNAFDPHLDIGLPASNFNHCEEEGWDTPFIIDDPDATATALPPEPGDCNECDYPQWNQDLETKFSHSIAEEVPSSYPKFDAIIFHNYYVAGNAYAGCSENTNWQVAAAEPTFTAGAPYTAPWTYPGFDANLGELFEGIAGIPTDPDGDAVFTEQTGNMKVFVRDRIKNAFDKHAEYLHFFDTDAADTKQVWFTEYNLLPKAKGVTADEDAPFVYMVPNTFAHAVALQNWILWNIKAYFDPDYKPGIFTIGTVQAFMGGNPIDMMTPASRNDQVVLDLPDAGIQCTTNTPIPAVDDYYVRRTTYYSMQLLNAIHTHDLHYAKTFVGLYMLNNNLPPTSFVELDASGVPVNIYVYYTNIKQTTQKYALDPGDLYLTIPYALGITLEAATIYALNPAQLSSTSGNNAMYTHAAITSAYGCDTPTVAYPAGENNPHPFEIINTGTSVSGTSCPGGFTPPTGGICVTVPATSAGYFVVPITVDERLGHTDDVFVLYPNPASAYFVVQHKTDLFDCPEALTIELYSLYGNLVHGTTAMIGEPVDVSMLPAGPYTVVIRADGCVEETKTLLRMH